MVNMSSFVVTLLLLHRTSSRPRELHIYDLLFNKSICIASHNGTIPKILFQMFWQVYDLPVKILHNRQKYASTYNYRIYDNYAFSKLFSRYFKPEVHDEAMKLKGPHRADMFRYAVMYLFGGVYLDIKTEMIMPLHWIFRRNYTTYTALGETKGVQSIFQGVIASPPCNPIFLHLIRNFVLARKPIYSKRYNLSTKQFYTLIAAMVGNMSLVPKYYENNFNVASLNVTAQQRRANKVGVGIGAANLQQKEHLFALLRNERDRPHELRHFNYELFAERDDTNDACWDGPDRYNMCSFVHASKVSWADDKGICPDGSTCSGTERVFKTRYADYPSAFNTSFQGTI